MKTNKTKKKTYAVAGYMEYVASLPLPGGRSVEVEFTGGKQSGYGVSPARFTTEDPVLQKLIENCDQFRQGLIRIHNR